MAKANPSVHQFEPFRVPSNWSLQEKKFVQQVEDTLLDLYGRFNRLRITDMAPAFRQEYTDNLGQVSQLQLSAQSFGVRMTSAEGDIGQLTLTSQGFATRITSVENTNTTQQTEINQNKAQILLRAEKTVTDGLNTRLTSAEQKITSDAITNTVRNHSLYLSDMAGKNRTYYLATAPSGAITGDLWVDTANGNILKRWNGSSWVSVQDGAISVAQQTANKFSWLIASGTSGSNMTLTERLYQLMTERVMITANASITLAVSNVQVGGRNLIPRSYINVTSSAYGFESRGPFYLKPNTQYTLTICGHKGTSSGEFRVYVYTSPWVLSHSVAITSASETVAQLTFTTASNAGSYPWYFSAYNYPSGSTGSVYCKWATLAEGNKTPTDWFPAPEDPAGGVKTPYITLDALGMEIQGGADFRLYAGSGVTSIGLANKRADGTFIFAGGADPATSPFRVGMDGAIRATKGQIGGFTLESGRMAAPGVGGIDFVLDWANAELSLGGFRVYSTPLGFVMVNRRTASSTGAEARLESLYSGIGLYGPSNSVISIGNQSQRFGLISANGASLFVGLMANTVSVNNDIYISNNCSALSFTDRTPAYIGNALDELRWTRGSRAKGIDHHTLPPFARKRIQGTREMPDGTMVPVEEEARDLGAMISILTKAVQELDEKTMALERRLPA